MKEVFKHFSFLYMIYVPTHINYNLNSYCVLEWCPTASAGTGFQERSRSASYVHGTGQTSNDQGRGNNIRNFTSILSPPSNIQKHILSTRYLYDFKYLLTINND